jgi:MFS family permease
MIRDQRSALPYPSLAVGIITTLVLVLGYIVSLVDRQIMSLLLTPIKADFGAGDFEMGLLVGFAFAIFYSIFGLPLGMIADRVSRKRLIAGGMILWSAATMACGFAGGFASLFLFRMLVGIGEATYTPAAYSMLADTFPPRRLVRATAVLSLGGSLGSGLALIIGGSVIAFFSTATDVPFGLKAFAPWQATFIVVGIPGLLVAAMVLLIREPLRRHADDADSRAAAQSFRFLAQRWRDYVPIYIVGAGMATTTYCGYSWFPTHLIRSFGLSPAEAGWLVGSIQVVGSIIGSVVMVVLTELLLKRGHSDAHLRSVMITSAGALMTMMGLFLPSLTATAVVWLISSILQHSYYGCLMAALQITTPNRARGANAAVYLLITTVIGLAGGTALVGAFGEYVFAGSPRGIGIGIAIVGGAGALVAATTAYLALPRYRRNAEPRLAEN